MASTATSCSYCSSSGLLSQRSSVRASPARQPCYRSLAPAKQNRRELSTGALTIDWSSVDTWIGVGGAVAGLGLGVGIPAFYMSMESRDEERLEELRELNRQTFKETGSYLSDDEVKAFRSPRWTDRRQFEDDD